MQVQNDSLVFSQEFSTRKNEFFFIYLAILNKIAYEMFPAAPVTMTLFGGLFEVERALLAPKSMFFCYLAIIEDSIFISLFISIYLSYDAYHH